MHWKDEGFLLSKNNFDENSIIIEAFTLRHGKYTGIVYGGASRKQKRNFQIGNKIILNWKSKGENKSGYFNIELVKPIAPLFFDDKKKLACILSSTAFLKSLLPERQINKTIYDEFEKMLINLNSKKWIECYIYWEISLIKQLGFEANFFKNNNKININGRYFQIPNFFLNNKSEDLNSKNNIKEALIFNKNLLMENFFIPNNIKFPLFRNILINYYI